MWPQHDDQHDDDTRGGDTRGSAGIPRDGDAAAGSMRDRYRDPDSVLGAALGLALVLVDAAHAVELVPTPGRTPGQVANSLRQPPEPEL
ncbi:hypothetical protein [Nocardia bovistercoris]|uniref:Uncharacterized protein n=1 Tax=Nocardia bovistercoris TaxID=2785916 RepID=A0A931N3H2_9NOCA|nr:hypothetical protein [Nocardia bovistercoris]MBH0776558.1 hypothetical protein [Nocardia bovistercoris]